MALCSLVTASKGLLSLGLLALCALGSGQSVIWVHYDYMVGADGHSHEPLRESIQNVVDAYRNHGLTLIIDPRHTAIPETTTTFFPAGPSGVPDSVDFNVIKAAYFHPVDARAWHYALFAHDVLYFGTPVSGAAELPGYGFVVSGSAIDAVAGILEGRILLEGGIFMHELGHNLGLRHGGDTDQLYKPNYMSVMNYSYLNGIATSPVPGTLMGPLTHRVDYSDRVLPTLDESNLDEFSGVGAGDGDIVRWMGFNRRTGIFFPNLRAPGMGPIDWDLSGTIDSSEEWDLNFDFTSGPDNAPPYNESKPWLLTGFDDWSQVRAFVNSPRYRAGQVIRSLPASRCPSSLPLPD